MEIRKTPSTIGRAEAPRDFSNNVVRTALLLALLMLMGGLVRVAPASEPIIKGALTKEHGVPTLRVWGTPYEQGFAHGYLLGPHIMNFVEAVLLDKHVVHDHHTYEHRVRKELMPRMEFGPAAEDELKGMFDGMRAKLSPDGLTFTRLGRSLDVTDLKALNTIADWRPAGCSSFAAWGDATSDGQMLVARNLDYLRLPGIDKLHLVVAHLEHSESRCRFVSISWPGMVGVYTGMNENGLVAAMHDAPAKRNNSNEKLVPRSIALREILETAPRSGTTDFVAQLLCRRQTLRGNNFLVASADLNQAAPAAVFEYDGSGQNKSMVTVRLPGNAINLTPAQTIACTNHYRVRGKPTKCRRYDAICDALETAIAKHQQLDYERALAIIDAASAESTLHTLIACPARREFRLHLASTDDRATRNPSNLFKLSELFTHPDP